VHPEHAEVERMVLVRGALAEQTGLRALASSRAAAARACSSAWAGTL